jgi:two-component system, response regulator PdtaR
MSQPTRRLRIAVADDERDMRQFFQELLPPLGHEVVVVAETGRQLVDQCRAARPDLVITDIKMPDMDGIRAAGLINEHEPVPVILVTGHHDADLLARAAADHIMAYLTKPTKPVDLQAAIALAMLRFEHFKTLLQEAASLRQGLEDRKVIEQAKGVVMRRLCVDESDGFIRMKRYASNRNLKLVDVSKHVLAAEEVFHKIESL